MNTYKRSNKTVLTILFFLYSRYLFALLNYWILLSTKLPVLNFLQISMILQRKSHRFLFLYTHLLHAAQINRSDKLAQCVVTVLFGLCLKIAFYHQGFLHHSHTDMCVHKAGTNQYQIKKSIKDDHYSVWIFPKPQHHPTTI